MTVPTTVSETSFVYTGSETVFPTGFRCVDAAHIRAELTSPDGVVSSLVNSVNYSVSIASDTGLATVSRLSFPHSAGTLRLWRESDFLQSTNFASGEAVPAETHENLHDAHVLRLQEMRRDIDKRLTSRLQFDASGPIAGRNLYNSSAKDFVYLQTDDEFGRLVYYVKLSATVGDWSGPLFIGSSSRIEVNNIAALRATPHAPNKIVSVSGYYAAGDGGGDNFYPSPIVPKAQFTGAIALSVDAGSGVDNILTVSAISSGAIYVGMKITGPGLSTPMYVWQFISGTNGGVGTYYVRDALGNPLNVSIASSAMTGTQYWDNGGTVIVPTGGDGTKAWLREIDGPVNVKWFGTKNANINLAVPSVVGFATLAAAQEIYPFVTSLTQNIDQVAIQAAILFAQGSFNRQYAVNIPQGRYFTNQPIIINNINGVKINGERTTSVYDGAFIDYSGLDFAFRLRNAKNPNIAVNNVSVTNGSPVISGVTSWQYLAAGMSILINGSAWGVIQSIGVNTVTSSVNYTGTTSSTATFDAAYGSGDIYRVEMSDLGIFCTNQTYAGGGVYGRYVDESKFHRVNIYGANGIYPNRTYKTQYGFDFEGCVLSNFSQCHISYVTYGWFNTRVLLDTSLTECKIFAVDTGIYAGDGIFALNIKRNYFELFENGILLANNSFCGYVDCWQMNIAGNTFKRSYATGSSRALNIQNVDNTKMMRVKYSFNDNYCDMSGFGGPAPLKTDYAVQIYLDGANANSSLWAEYSGNTFTWVNVAGVSVSDTGLRPLITEYNNKTTDGWSNTYLRNFVFIQDGISKLSNKYSLFRKNESVVSQNSTAEQILSTFVIPGNFLNYNGSFEIKTNFTLANNANAKTIKLRFNSLAGPEIASISAANAAVASLDATISNRNSNNSQIISYRGENSAGAISIGNATSSIDTTAPVTIVATITKATAADLARLEYLHVDANTS